MYVDNLFLLSVILHIIQFAPKKARKELSRFSWQKALANRLKARKAGLLRENKRDGMATAQ